MDHEAILLELIKDTRQAVRDIQARIYNLSTTFVVFSFAITAFAFEKAKELLIPITFFSDMAIAIVLIFLYVRICAEHKLVRLTVEKYESALIHLMGGKAVPPKDIVVPPVDLDATPALSATREANLFLWAATIVMTKAVLVVMFRS